MANQNDQFGARVCQLRRLQGLTQEKLAEMVDCSVQFLSMVENGQRGISLRMFCQLAAALHVSANELLGLTQDDDTVTDREFCALLKDCNERERRIMLDTAEAVKYSLRRNREVAECR